jgi:hypothetical protein
MKPHASGRRAFALAAFALFAALLLPAPARAQAPRPWLPAGSDSVTILSRQARARFQTAKGDSAVGGNYEAYSLVSDLARHLVARLGRANLLQAPAIESVMDSTGLDTDVRVDAAQPGMLFLLVRNPYRPGADAVGYLLWYRGAELRLQGAVFPPCVRPRFRAWWLGSREVPYAAAVLFDERRSVPEMGLRLFRMTPNGAAWNLVQYEDDLVLGEAGDAVFADPNGDGRPEVVAWTRVEPDSFLALASGAPRLMTESLWAEGASGYRMRDLRVMPSPVSVLVGFLRHVLAGNRDAAERMLADPKRMGEVQTNGWSQRRARGAWTVEYGDPGTAWTDWLAVREKDGGVDRRWIFRFELREGRWLIREWTAVKPAAADAPLVPGGSK